MLLVGHVGFQTEQAHLTSLTEELKEAASHDAEITNEKSEEGQKGCIPSPHGRCPVTCLLQCLYRVRLGGFQNSLQMT